MSEDFEKALAASIQGINDAFDQANNDLGSVVTELDAATARITNRFRLGLEVLNEDLDGRVYKVTLKGEKHSVTVGAYRVGPTGYPIQYGIWVGIWDTRGTLANPDKLREHFMEMAQNTDSTLMRSLAYQLREDPT